MPDETQAASCECCAHEAPESTWLKPVLRCHAELLLWANPNLGSHGTNPLEITFKCLKGNTSLTSCAVPNLDFDPVHAGFPDFLLRNHGLCCKYLEQLIERPLLRIVHGSYCLSKRNKNEMQRKASLQLETQSIKINSILKNIYIPKLTPHLL